MSVDLVAERLNRGYSIRSAAKAIGIDRRTLEAAERGDSLHPASAKKIADHYGVLVSDFPQFKTRAAA